MKDAAISFEKCQSTRVPEFQSAPRHTRTPLLQYSVTLILWYSVTLLLFDFRPVLPPFEDCVEDRNEDKGQKR